MSVSKDHKADEVEQLLRNAHLRDELEPLCDESISSVNISSMPTPVENEFLASMLAWERAPTLPIAKWFDPELKLPTPDDLTDRQLSGLLYATIDSLYEKRIVLDFTDHLSDRGLYCLIYRDILPAVEKKIDATDNYLHWDCAHVSDDPETWLRFYATVEEREAWASDTGEVLPEMENPPYRRQLPRAPM